jgi:hypothetical protein
MKATFKPVSSAPAQKSEQPAIDVAAKDTTESTPDVSAALAPRTESQVSTQVHQPTFGGEDEVDAADIKYPRLNLLQAMSDSALKAIAPEGNFVLAKDFDLGTKLRAVVVGFGPLRYIEKTKYVKGVNSNARIVNSLQEVDEANGTTEWRESKLNEKIKSDKTWFQKARTALLLIEKPEGADDSRFPFIADGKAYAVALFSVKSTSYDSFYVKLNSENKTGALRGGFYSGVVEITAPAKTFTGGTAYNPQPKVVEKASDELVKLALSLRG